MTNPEIEESRKENRLFLAGMAMTMFRYSNTDWYDDKERAAKQFAKDAVKFANALLKELDKESEG